MRKFIFVMVVIAWTTNVYSQAPPNSPQPPETSQPAASLQNGPASGPGTATNQPASPGTGPLEGAQPGQSGTAQDLQRRAIDSQRARSQSQFPRQPGDQQQRIDQLNPRPGMGPPAIEQPRIDGRAVDRANALGRARTFQGAPRGRAREGERGFIINDLRARGLVADDWRIVLHGGRWWFWTPEETWLIYGDDGDWIAYEPGVFERRQDVARRPVVVFPPGYPREEWRLVFHDGRWWFWAPNERWLYFDRGRWVALSDRANALARERQLQRQRLGYRGVEEPSDRMRDGEGVPSEMPDNQPLQPTPQPSPEPSGGAEGDMDP
jgi:hypothetical protein